MNMVIPYKKQWAYLVLGRLGEGEEIKETGRGY
jgi:hypothetical protein